MLLAALPVALLAQATRDSIISVSASRTVRIPPDRASLYLVVEGTAETPTDAIARVDSKLKQVVEAMRRFGSHVKLDAPIAYGVGPTPAPNGYPGVASPATNISRSVVHLDLDQPEQTAQVVAAAIAAGAANASALTFESTVMDSVRRVRVAEALNAARSDAEVIAKSLGAHLGALVSVSTNGGPVGFTGLSTLAFDNRFPQQTQTPDVAVTTSVTVQYRIVR